MTKLRKILLSIFLFIILTFSGCSYFIPQTNHQINTGTYSGEFYSLNDFNQLPIYVSNAYLLNSIDAYNDVLFNTKDRILKATVSIRTTISSGFTEDVVSGSGFIFQSDETHFYVVTNHHVVSSKTTSFSSISHSVKAYGDSSFNSAEVIVSNQDLDLAVLKFEINQRTNIEMLDIYQRLGYRFKANEMVFAIGNPLRYTNNVSIGRYERLVYIENVDFFVIEHSAEIDEGSSGGALVDVEGNLIGVNTWGSNNGLKSYAIPIFVLYNFLVSNDIIVND